MAKVKMQKKMTSIDMTAMCDVAFLLLTFFILTATAKQPEPLPVDTPASTVQTKLPENNLATITIGQGGKVFFGVTGKDVRRETLKKMGKEFGVTFTPEQEERFTVLESFGVPIEGLQSIIEMRSDERNKANQPGIPKDSLNNQLAKWILFARTSTQDATGEDMKVAIKGDAKEEYPAIKKVMDILQDQRINSFNLVTGLRSDNF